MTALPGNEVLMLMTSIQKPKALTSRFSANNEVVRFIVIIKISHRRSIHSSFDLVYFRNIQVVRILKDFGLGINSKAVVLCRNCIAFGVLYERKLVIEFGEHNCVLMIKSPCFYS